jgi:deazaflavin-dependent oxidoreductase (nitroreductase family)
MTAKGAELVRIPPRLFVRIAWLLHRALLRFSGGRFGLSRPEVGERFGMMRLTTLGRRSGQQRVAIVGYYADGENLVTLAMNGWADAVPAWWLNLQAQPDTMVELPDGRRSLRARAARGAERERLWARFGDYPGWGDDITALAAARSNETAVVVLEPTAADGGASAEPSTNHGNTHSANEDKNMKALAQSTSLAGDNARTENHIDARGAIGRTYATLSLVTLTAAAVVIGVHHVYREGLVLLVPFAILAALPYLLIRWFRASGSRPSLWSYGALSTVIILGFSFVDGFLDHVLNASLGLYASATGQEADHLERAFRVLPPTHLVGDFFYEATGILEFVVGVVAAYYAYRFLRAARAQLSLPAGRRG